MNRVPVYNWRDVEKFEEIVFPRKIQELKHLRENVNWEIEKERYNLLDILLPFCGQFLHLKNRYFNLREIFQPEEIERLLMDSVARDQDSLIRFVVSCGFKDEPKVDEEGNLLLRHTTALHRMVNLLRYQEITPPTYEFHRKTWADDQNRASLMVSYLFEIYNRFDVNYTDEDGFTHLHAACKYGFYGVVEKFLELGQDPNCLEHVTGNSPLHLAATSTHQSHRVIALLLNGGADPNLANAIGWTPLHIISQRYRDDDFMEVFFNMCEGRGIALQVDARDKLGRTPLQWAVLGLKPRVVDVLLDHGADLSKFVFPTENYLADRQLVQEPQCEIKPYFKLRLGSGALAVAERLENRGYKMDRSHALSIMKFFAKYGLFEKSAKYVEERWYDDEFESAKGIFIKWNLSLYDLIQLRPKEEDQRLKYEDYFEFADTCLSYIRHSEVCAVHLCEKLSRGFFQRWALYPFWELMHQRLSIEICEMIIEKLRNEDLYNICLAAANQSDTYSERNTITSTYKSNNKRPRENEDLKPSKKLRD